jgi:hypothetical protein
MKAIRLPDSEWGRTILVLLVLLVSSGYFFPRLSNWGANSRMDLIYALGDKGVVNIDDYHLNTGDKAFFQGHYYLEKSIGPSLAGLPAYMAFRALVRMTPLGSIANGSEPPGALPTVEQVYEQSDLPEPGTPGAGHRILYHAMALSFVTLFSVALMSATLGAAVYRMASRFSSAGNALILAFAFGLGTPAFAFSNELFQHQVGAFGAFVGFFLLWRVVDEGASHRYLWLVGALFGLAAASEYVLAPILACVVLWAIPRIRPRRHLLRVAAGSIPWVIATATYNVIAFRTPMPIGYRYSAFGIPEGSLFGLVPPSWGSVFGITFSPYRGLFLLSPFLLLAPAGLYVMSRRGGRTRSLARVLLFVCVAFLAYNACYWVWDGGSSVGPRHLVPMLPFLSMPIIFILDAAKHLWQRAGIGILVVVSIAGVWMQSLAGHDFPPDTVDQPILEYALPLLRQGGVRFSLGHLLGLRGLTTLIPLVLILAAIPWLIRSGERAWLTRRSRGASPTSETEVTT